MKKCKKCNIEKDKNDFYSYKKSKDGKRSICILCFKKYVNKYKKINKDKIRIKNKLYNELNKERISKIRKKRYKRNVDCGRSSEYNRIYYQQNKKKIIQKNNNRRKNDDLYRLICNIRSRIRNYLYKNKIYKNNKTFKMIGCSPSELKIYIENLFTEGMCWDKVGKYIHIDHIIPLSSAKNIKHLYELCHYTNLQPLWSKDNLVKSNKI